VAALAHLSLVRANAIHEVVESGSQFVGPALAGVLVSRLGANNVLWVDAASFAVSAALIAAAVPRAAPVADRPARSYRHDLAEGLRFVFHDPPIRAIFVSATALNFLISRRRACLGAFPGPPRPSASPRPRSASPWPAMWWAPLVSGQL